MSHHAARPTNRLAARPDQRDALAALLFLLIGGRVLAGQYVIQFCGAEVKLTHAAFSALLDLVRALLTTETGLSPLPSVASGKGGVHQTVRRLRAAIDAALGAGTGARFVQSCGRGTYRLAIPVEGIVIQAAFAELAPEHLDRPLVDELLAAAARRTEGASDLEEPIAERR